MSERISTVDDAARRADYLAEVMDLLYPPPWQAGDPGADSAERVEYIVVPDLRRPRVLVPAASRRLAATALRHYARPASRTARLKRDAAAAALWTGADRLLLRDRIVVTATDPTVDDIARYLGAELGERVHLGVHIGPARANRKPVLQLLSPRGSTLGFAKLGVNALTRDLVRAETAALRRVTRLDLSRVRVPRVLHAGTWRDHVVLVCQALPGWARPSPCPPAMLAAAMRELAECTGVAKLALSESGYAAGLHARLAELAGRADSDAVALVPAGRRLLAEIGDRTMSFGAWHGDWTPWNMTTVGDTVYLWDFERFGAPVPLGFDALHFALQRDIVTDGSDPTTAVLTMMRRAAALLAPFGVTEPAARDTALLYLIDLAARYLTDRQEEAGAALGALGRWLLPTLLRHVTTHQGGPL